MRYKKYIVSYICPRCKREDIRIYGNLNFRITKQIFEKLEEKKFKPIGKRHNHFAINSVLCKDCTKAIFAYCDLVD